MIILLIFRLLNRTNLYHSIIPKSPTNRINVSKYGEPRKIITNANVAITIADSVRITIG